VLEGNGRTKKKEKELKYICLWKYVFNLYNKPKYIFINTKVNLNKNMDKNLKIR
jgi:hypothetical protein